MVNVTSLTRPLNRMKETPLTLPLPSLIHRIGGERVKQAKALALEFHCELKRVRRSRHWQLIGLPDGLIQFHEAIQQQEDESFGYLVKKLEESLRDLNVPRESVEAKLERIITEQPNVTLTELMRLTDCSMSQARRARFDAEIL
ncbi:ribosome recycling factor family protein [Vibrio sp. ZSDE26]|uniref:Ribosome recycling factor family protein n=1 Tax=Vibrio amylolyticus TaxID=2847292 RepID=A0A9X1XJR4_9VIBR|nr:ribosome recycling factor family protein [Vibrio amylolyticus]MCK6264522.1 ribosome recycling factor family protein [Vibrio amylolyticus]